MLSNLSLFVIAFQKNNSSGEQSASATQSVGLANELIAVSVHHDF